MVQYPARFAHAAAGDDDHRPLVSVKRLGIFLIADESQVQKLKRTFTLLDHLARLLIQICQVVFE